MTDAERGDRDGAGDDEGICLIGKAAMGGKFSTARGA